MATKSEPRRHWLDLLPTGAEALDEPFSASRRGFLRMECERCGAERYTNQVHSWLGAATYGWLSTASQRWPAE